MSQLQVTGEAKIRDIQGPVVANSGVVTALDGAASQYVRGDGTLADFPTSTGGGSSVSYYLNSSVSQGTIGGVAYREFSKDAITGAGTDITISANGYVASYITDANDPSLLEVPSGNFNCEFYFTVDSDAHNPYVYAELYKYDGTTFTLLGSSQSVPEYLTSGTTLAPYYFAIPVATSALTITDRIAIRIYVNVDGRTVTLHTENNHLCQVVTTFSKGMISLNNLTKQNQYLATGTSGTNFAIVSTGDTHTFNLPVASATNTGKLSSTDWSTFNNKIAGSGTINTIPKFTASGTIGDSSLSDDSGTLRYQGIGFRGLDIKSTNNSTSIRLESYSGSTNADNGIKEIEMDGYYSSFNSYFGYNSSGAEWLMTGYADIAGNTTNRGTTTWQIPSLDGTYGYFDVRSYHSATPIIRAFASNNVVIGGSTNNSFKLEVVGTAKISGVLTLGSTISNGTNTYTLPSATGTLALTSNLSSYVPYTGATSNVNLGVYDISVSGIKVESNVSGGTAVNIKQNSTTLIAGAGYISIGAKDLDTLLFQYGGATNSDYKVIRLKTTNIPNTTSRAYEFPNADGTIALTSNIPSVSGTSTYIPVFTGSNSLGNSQIWNNGGIIGMGTNYSNPAFYVVASSGDTLTQGKLAINTTSFSGTSVLQVNGAATFSSDLTIAAAGQIYLTSGDLRFNSNAGFGIVSQNGTRLVSIQNGAFGVSGAATFSSNLTLSSSSSTTDLGGVLIVRGNGSAHTTHYLTTGAANVAKYIQYNASGTAINLIDAGGVSYFNGGNVGIGTSSPSAALDIDVAAGLMMRVKRTGVAGEFQMYQGPNVVYLDSAAASGNLAFATVGTERMRIRANGNVAIGNTGNDSIRMVVRGQTSDSSTQSFNVGKQDGTDLIYVRNDGYLYSVGAWSGSDIRLKENITDLHNGLQKVLGLKAKKFDLIDGLKNNYGFIAQEMQEVIPDAVSVFEEKEQLLAVRMDYIIPHLVKAIQEQQEQIEELKALIAAK